VVDTTGAGDVFHGALALGLAEARPEADAVRFAAAAAALKCTRHGAGEGAPGRLDVETLLAGH
jgi:sugar/nucleoside kinase (ribokinase family)